MASEPITQEQRREWRALAEQAHEGTKRQPWVAVDCPYEGRWIRAEFPDYGDVRVARNVHTSAHRYIAHSSPDRVLALLAAYDAVTAERDRLLVTVERQGNANEGLGARIRELRAALAQAERDLSWTEPQRPRVKKARADMKAALWRDDHPGHTHPRPCSICRREDCTVLHACE